MTMTPAEKVAILYDVLDWLEANPDKAITGALASDDTGIHCSPFDPAATCFCYTGRLQHVTGLRSGINGDRSLSAWLTELQSTSFSFMRLNDLFPDKAARFRELRHYINDIAKWNLA